MEDFKHGVYSISMERIRVRLEIVGVCFLHFYIMVCMLFFLAWRKDHKRQFFFGALRRGKTY